MTDSHMRLTALVASITAISLWLMPGAGASGQAKSHLASDKAKSHPTGAHEGVQIAGLGGFLHKDSGKDKSKATNQPAKGAADQDSKAKRSDNKVSPAASTSANTASPDHAAETAKAVHGAGTSSDQPPVFAPDAALISVMQDLLRSLKEPEATAKIENVNLRAVLDEARQILAKSLEQPDLPADRIARQHTGMSTEAWAPGEVKLDDGSRGSLAVVWAKRENGMINVTIVGDSPTKTAPNGRKLGEFVVVLNARSPMSKGMDIQTQSEVSFWIGKLNDIEIECDCAEPTENATASDTTDIKKKTCLILQPVVTDRVRQYLSKLHAFQSAIPAPRAAAAADASAVGSPDLSTDHGNSSPASSAAAPTGSATNNSAAPVSSNPTNSVDAPVSTKATTDSTPEAASDRGIARESTGSNGSSSAAEPVASSSTAAPATAGSSATNSTSASTGPSIAISASKPSADANSAPADSSTTNSGSKAAGSSAAGANTAPASATNSSSAPAGSSATNSTSAPAGASATIADSTPAGSTDAPASASTHAASAEHAPGSASSSGASASVDRVASAAPAIAAITPESSTALVPTASGSGGPDATALPPVTAGGGSLEADSPSLPDVTPTGPQLSSAVLPGANAKAGRGERAPSSEPGSETIRQPSASASVIVPDRAIAGQLLTASVVNNQGICESAVELTFNGSVVQTDKKGAAVYMVPEDANPGRSLSILLAARPDGPVYGPEVLQPLTVPAEQEVPKIDRLTAAAKQNQNIIVDGHNFNGFGAHNRILIDARLDARVLAASPVQLKIQLPSGLASGVHSLTIGIGEMRSNPTEFNFVAMQPRTSLPARRFTSLPRRKH